MDKHSRYTELLEKCIAFHGHLCMGQIPGVRVAAKGLELASPETPRDLIVAVEVDRCLADAVLMATGMRLGRRNLKLDNYGRMAASFLNCVTGKAYRARAAYQGPQSGGNGKAMRAVLLLSDEQVAAWEEVELILPEDEMPGSPRRTVVCSVCGEKVFDGKDRPKPEGPTCQAFLGGACYSAGKH